MYRRGWRLVVAYARAQPGLLAVALVGSVTFALTTVGSSWALGRVVDHLVEPRFAGRTVSAATVVWVLAALVLLGLVRAASIVMRRTYAAKWQHATEAESRTAVLDRFDAQPLSWHQRQSTGTLLAAAESDPEAASAIQAPLPYSFGVVVLLLVAPVWLVVTDPVVGLTAVTLMPVMALINVLYQRRLEGPAQRVQQGLAGLTATAHEALSGIAVVKTMGAEQLQQQRFDDAVTGLRDIKIHQLRRRADIDILGEALPSLMSVVLVLVGSARVSSGAMRPGSLVAIVSLYSLLVWPLRMIGFALSELPRTLAGRTRLDALAAEPIDPIVEVLPAAPGIAVAAHHVRYTHRDGRIALDDVDVEIPIASTVAVVGPTGSGKTTLLLVLAGLLAPDEGVVEHGVEPVVMAFQEPYLFSGPIRDSLDVAGRGPQVVARAIALARADGFVGRLESGVDTVVGERGATLSGGQRQRLALARAVASGPQVLLLDDTTSSLDPTTEAQILAAMNRELHDTTVVMVSSRPSSIALADSVVFLRSGRVIDHATHAELLERHADYRALVDAYAADRAEAEAEAGTEADAEADADADAEDAS